PPRRSGGVAVRSISNVKKSSVSSAAASISASNSSSSAACQSMSTSRVVRARFASLMSSANPPLSSHRSGAASTRRARSRSNATRLRSRARRAPSPAARVRRRCSRAWRNAAGSPYLTLRFCEKAVDEAPHSLGSVGRCGPQAPRRHQATLNRLPDGELDLLRLRAGLEGVDDRALGARRQDSVHAAGLLRAWGIREHVEPDAGLRPLTALFSRQRDVDGGRDHVRKLVQLERAL